MEKIFGLDMTTVEKLAQLVKDNELAELALRDGEKSITIKGKMCPPPPPRHDMRPVPPEGQSFSFAPQNTAPATSEPAEAPAGKVVKAPLVGTYYSSPAPGKAPFVSAGDRVKKGDTLMIIESMKLMNEINSEYDGIVKEILVNDGDIVEYDQPVMIIE